MYIVRGEKYVVGQLPTITFHKKVKTLDDARKVASKYFLENETAYNVTIIPIPS